MQLSISNIAWDKELDEVVAELLLSEGVHCIDVAPGKYFPNFDLITINDISRVREFWESRGIKIIGMQSLLYGTTGLNLFDKTSQPAMLAHLQRIRWIAAHLGVERMTFGSPKNRDRSKLTDLEANAIAGDFFRRWSKNRLDGNVQPRLLLEPNPPLYGANFLTTTESAAAFVRELNDSLIGLQLDIGTLTINKEAPDVIEEVATVTGHVHVSEPQLVPVGTTDAPHKIYAEHLKAVPAKYLTIEMVEKDSRKQLDSICRAIRFVKRLYAGVL